MSNTINSTILVMNKGVGNPYHDKLGKFTTGPGAGGGSTSGGDSKASKIEKISKETVAKVSEKFPSAKKSCREIKKNLAADDEEMEFTYSGSDGSRDYRSAQESVDQCLDSLTKAEKILKKPQFTEKDTTQLARNLDFAAVFMKEAGYALKDFNKKTGYTTYEKEVKAAYKEISELADIADSAREQIWKLD